MSAEIPKYTYSRGIRQVFYVAKKNKIGKEVTAILIDPEGTELPIILFMEIGYGAYVGKFNLSKLGPYFAAFHENGNLTGHAVYWASL